MPIEFLMSSVLFGLAVAMAAWAGEPFFTHHLDRTEAAFRDKLKRLRIYPKRLRVTIIVWCSLVLAHFLLMSLVFDVPVIGLVLSLLLLGVPWYFLKRWTEKRRELIEDQLADSMVSLSSAIKAGLSLAQALEILAKQSPKPISQEFGQIIAEYQMGKTMERCLDEARERLRSENFALFSAAMQASRESGGKLNETVERIAVSVREMQRLERKVIADTAQARTSAFYMALVPFAILALYYFVVDPINTEKLFTTVIGQLFLCASIVLNVVAYLWARHILNPDI
ncbi:MAG TPA: type II secretion system F family protein [Schlesneria sp.]